jgi:tetratricopeptide (TPR) repeat protein
VDHLTGDYHAAANRLQRALALFGELDNLRGQALALNSLGVVQQETGDYPAAAASQRQALALFRDQGGQLGQAEVLNDLGVLQQETGDFPAAAAIHQRALVLFRDLGDHLGQAQALAIVRDLGAPREEGRTLEGLGRACLLDGNPGEAAGHLTRALRIYQRIGDPAEQRVQQTLQKHGMTSATSEPSPPQRPRAKSISRAPATPRRSR